MLACMCLYELHGIALFVRRRTTFARSRELGFYRSTLFSRGIYIFTRRRGGPCGPPYISLKEKGKMFLSNKTMFDVCSMMGFEAYCDILFKMYPGSSVLACYTNQDKLENFFGEQRVHNGQRLIQQLCKQVRTILYIFIWLLSVSLY